MQISCFSFSFGMNLTLINEICCSQKIDRYVKHMASERICFVKFHAIEAGVVFQCCLPNTIILLSDILVAIIIFALIFSGNNMFLYLNSQIYHYNMSPAILCWS